MATTLNDEMFPKNKKVPNDNNNVRNIVKKYFMKNYICIYIQNH